MKKHTVPQFAVCINNTDYLASLELHKIYQIVPDDDARTEGDLRIIDESGEDYLYPSDWFVDRDATVEYTCAVCLDVIQGSVVIFAWD